MSILYSIVYIIINLFGKTKIVYFCVYFKKVMLRNLKSIFFVFALLSTLNSFCQVGISNSTPEAALDIVSGNSGVLMPRVALNSITDNATVINPNGGFLVNGTMVWNTGTAGLRPAGYFYWQNNQWNQVLANNQSQVYFGKLILTKTGTVSTTGIGFTPSSVEFVAINRVQNYDVAYRSGDNNSNDIRMAGGFTTGYASNNAGRIEQQVISNAFSGSSINNIGTYASSNHCLAAYFVDNNGSVLRDTGTSGTTPITQQGLVRAAFQSFDNDGFTINVDRFLGPPLIGSPDRSNALVVIYKAYR